MNSSRLENQLDEIEADLPDNEFQVTDPRLLPSTPEGFDDDLREKMAERGARDLYFLCTVILGYTKLVPHAHLAFSSFLTKAVYDRRMLLMPRTHFKTTIATIAHTIQLIIQDPNIQILMVADTAKNAERFLEEIKQHFERNALFRAVYPKLIPENFNKATWSKTEIAVPRTRVSREPTIDAIGAFGSIESRHYDYIKADDLVTEEAIRSDVKMEKLIQWAGGLESLLIPASSTNWGRIDWVGSRKKQGDLYHTIQKQYGEGYRKVDIGPHAHVQGRLAIFTRSVRENGEYIFPEGVDHEHLQRLRKFHPDRYHAQYANSPKGTGLNTFQIEWVGTPRWTPGDAIECIRDNEVALRVDPWAMERIVLFDPAVAERGKSSMNAIILVAKGSHPFRIVIESKIGHYPPDEAVEYLFDLQERWSPSIISIEKRGYQGSIKYWLNEKAEREWRAYLPIVEWPPEGSHKAQWAKQEHIRGLQPMVRAGYLWVMPGNDELLDQLEFYPNVTYDDGLDCLAQGLEYWPIMMDEETRMLSRDIEDEVLERVTGVPVKRIQPLEERNFDEAAFLRQFDYLGYGQKRIDA